MAILIKGEDIALRLTNGKWVIPPPDDGFIHDTKGEVLDRCAVFIGPYRTTGKPVRLTGSAFWYFGIGAKGQGAHIDVPTGPWNPIGIVKEIVYSRPAREGDFVHPFSPPRPTLLRSGRWLQILLPENCTLDWRGFVYP